MCRSGIGKGFQGHNGTYPPTPKFLANNGINIIFILLDSKPVVENPLNETDSSLTTKDEVETNENSRYE